MNERDQTYLRHILDSIRAIRTYTSGGELHFLSSQLHQDAVIRHFQIIGEAGSRLSEDIRECGEIPWKDVKAFRNFIVHQYMDIRPALVWRVVANDLPVLEGHVRALLGS
jgi:uncharacterized protein with HEPN domain